MFDSIELVAEVLIVGTLVLVASVPLLRELGISTDAIAATFGKIETTSGLPKIAVAGAIAYVVGIVFTSVPARLESFDTSAESSYEQWSRKSRRPVVKLRDAEFALRARGDGIPSWIERHKSYTRIAAGAAIAVLMMALGFCVSAIRIVPHRVRARRQLLVAGFAFVMLSYTWWAQKDFVDTRVCKAYVQLVLQRPKHTLVACDPGRSRPTSRCSGPETPAAQLPSR